MSLQDPSKKMSKSDNVQNFLALVTLKTYSKNQKSCYRFRKNHYDVSRPGISNLLVLFSPYLKSIESWLLNDAGYAVFKSDLAECVVNQLCPFKSALN